MNIINTPTARNVFEWECAATGKLSQSEHPDVAPRGYTVTVARTDPEDQGVHTVVTEVWVGDNPLNISRVARKIVKEITPPKRADVGEENAE